MQQQSNAFATAPEWTSAIAGLTNDQIVNVIYLNAFGHSPDAAGLRFWSDAITNGILSVGDAAWQIVTNTGPADTAIVAAKVTAAIGYTDAVTADSADSIAYSNSAAFASANTWLDGITTEAQATAALVPATLSASLDAMVVASNASSATTYALTTGIDTINAAVLGANVLNTVTSGLQENSTSQTWNTGDSITGNNLTTVSLIGNGQPGAGASVVSVTNVAAINMNLVADTTLNAAQFTNVAAVNVTNGVAASELTVSNAALGTTYGVSSANDYDVTLEYTGATGTADTATLSASGTGNSTTATTFDVATGNVIEAIALATSGTNYLTVDGGTGAATITVTGAGTNDITISDAAANMTINASGNSGTNVLRVGTLFTSLDTITGGSGTDTLRAVANTGTTRATISAVETLRFDFDNAGAIQDLRNVTGATTLTLEGDENATVTRAAATIATVNLVSETASVNASVTYATGSNAATALNIGTTNDDGDAVVAVGAVTVAGNAGALTINSVGDDDNTAAGITANTTTSLTINAATVGLSLGTDDISATSATTFTVNASGADITFDDATLTDATAITLNATGGAIATGILLTEGDLAEVSLTASGANANDITVDQIDSDFARTIAIAASGGSDITVSDIVITGTDDAGDDIDTEITLSALGTGTVVTVSDMTVGAGTVLDLVTITSDANGTVSFTATDTTLTITEIDATASAGTLTINVASLDDGVEVSTGAGDSTVTLSDNADTFVGGAGDDTVTGGDAADDITLGGGHDTVIITTNATTDSVGDFIAGATTVTSSDNISFDLSALNAIFTDVITGNATNVAADDAVAIQAIQANAGVGEALSAATNVVYVEGTYASVDAVQTAIETGGTNEITLTAAIGDAIILMYQDTSGNTQVASLSIANAASTASVILAGNAVVDNLVTLVGVDIADVVAGNYAFIS
jgi:hypothetical protein